jgi:hypothetical protein
MKYPAATDDPFWAGRRVGKPTTAEPLCKLEWSNELQRMVLRRDDGTIWDVGFGNFSTEKRADPY